MTDTPKVDKSPPPVRGRLKELPNGCLVFLGKRDDKPQTYFVGFRNEKGDDLKFTLSFEAMEALHDLYTNKKCLGLPLRDFPHKMEWHVVNEMEEIQ